MNELDTLTFGEVASERHNDMQAVSMEAEDASSTCAVTQFVGDNKDLKTVSIYGNTPFHSMGLIKITSPETPSADYQMSAVKR